jgi:hypothetical protein
VVFTFRQVVLQQSSDPNLRRVLAVEGTVVMMRRVLGATTLALILTGMLAERAAATCMVQPLSEAAGEADDVWWGTVIEATPAPPESFQLWELTVRVDDVLKGDGAPGDTFSVFTYSCGPPIVGSGAERFAPQFVGDQRLFLVSTDEQHRFIANGEVIEVGGGTRMASAHEQYVAALRVLDVPRDTTTTTTTTPVTADNTRSAPVIVLILIAAAMLVGYLLVIVVLRHRRA